MTELRCFHLPEQLIIENLTVGLVDTENRQLGALGIGICDPDPVSPDYGRRPGLAFQWRFPSYISVFSPSCG
jgi:hypothetical protein